MILAAIALCILTGYALYLVLTTPAHRLASSKRPRACETDNLLLFECSRHLAKRTCNALEVWVYQATMVMSVSLSLNEGQDQADLDESGTCALPLPLPGQKRNGDGGARDESRAKRAKA